MIKIILLFRRRAGMSHQDFMDYRREVHAPLLLAIPEAKYIRKFVVSYPVPAPNYPEPRYDAVVEAWFNTMAELNGLFSSENFLHKVDPDHENFIDLTSVERIITEEITVIS
ncbi:EthD domain-containing protein [Sodalis sp. C49]|uniref:EthD domain-containing protein n=1 Tax=unclassified Sodalis (in: enterobacteria) TaxID=2636512 RepID=UPI00396599F2